MRFGRDSHQLPEGDIKIQLLKAPCGKQCRSLATHSCMWQGHSVAFAREWLEPPSLAPGRCDS